MKNDLDKIIASVPANKTAARVMSGGEHYDPPIKNVERKYSDIPLHSDAPFQCIPIPAAARKNPNFVDLTGRKFGRLTVIGYLGRLNPKNDKKSFWMVRCVCGNYESRKQAFCKAAPEKAHNAQCAKCAAWATVKRKLEREGSRPIDDFIGAQRS